MCWPSTTLPLPVIALRQGSALRKKRAQTILLEATRAKFVPAPAVRPSRFRGRGAHLIQVRRNSPTAIRRQEVRNERRKPDNTVARAPVLTAHVALSGLCHIVGRGHRTGGKAWIGLGRHQRPICRRSGRKAGGAEGGGPAARPRARSRRAHRRVTLQNAGVLLDPRSSQLLVHRLAHWPA